MDLLLQMQLEIIKDIEKILLLKLCNLFYLLIYDLNYIYLIITESIDKEKKNY